MRSTEDLAARYSDEQFVVLLPGTSGANSLHMANRLASAVRQLSIPHEKSDVEEVATITLGVAAMVSSSECCANDLVAMAQQALENSKGQGRNCATLHADAE